jgi:cell pole-organizing protein PopZ
MGPAAAATSEWLFPQPGTDGTAKDKASSLLSTKEMEATLPPGSPAAPQSASLANKMESPAEPKAGKQPAPPAAGIGPPAPRLGDLGSVVPSKLESAGSVPAPAVGPPASGVNGERSVLGPPLAGPLLGEPTRAPASSGPLPEVPGADALRRLIADVVPPSAHPGMSPGLKGPDASAARPPDAPKPETGTKPAPEIKAEAKAAPTLEPKKPDAAAPPAPVTAPAPRPVAAELPPKSAAVATAPAPKPAAAPAPEPQCETSTQTGPAKSAAPSAAKTIDETVVEMLRPLLREWLDKNMPRLIEPALKAEIEALRNAVAKEAKD